MAKRYVRKSLVVVYNAPDTTDLSPQPENGWLAGWLDAKGYEENEKFYCVSCNKKIADRGGHVWNGRNLPLYIVPLCASCNADENTAAFCVPKASKVEENLSDKAEWASKHVKRNAHQ